MEEGTPMELSDKPREIIAPPLLSGKSGAGLKGRAGSIHREVLGCWISGLWNKHPQPA